MSILGNIASKILYSILGDFEQYESLKYQKPIMTITPDHWIKGVNRQPLAGGIAMDIRRFLVIHFTSGWTAQSSVDFWNTPEANGASAHVIIDRDGSIIQCRPFNRTCGHAGQSKWKDPKTGRLFVGLNSCSIGIELANAGDMSRDPDVYPKTMGALAGVPVPRRLARHKNGGPITGWELYPTAQLDACEALSKALVAQYNLDDVIGHDDIAPNRKVDPGPAYPLDDLRVACGFPAKIG
jgi:N-acetylmuramoyl-L-alanine amidase